jgi:hypothetical protein
MSRASVAIRKGVTAFLGHVLPTRTKRLIFLASFSARVKEEDATPSSTLDNAALRKLNELLTLGADPKALGLPVQLSRVIWRGRSVADIAGEQLPIDRITPDRVESVSQQIVSAMPQWLKYDPTDKMVGDVKKLLVHYRLLSA